MSTNALDLQERRKWRQMFPLLAGPSTSVICLKDGAAGVILEISERSGHLAYLVELVNGPMRLVFATDLDVLSSRSPLYRNA